VRTPQAVIKALSAYLKTAIPSVTSITDEWPNPSQNLVFPCITVLLGEPNFVQAMNYVVWKDTVPQVDGKFKLRKVNGTYDFVLKAHLWADSKPKRHELYDLFMKAMNPDFTVSGLRLKMTDYFDEYATFDLSKTAFIDSGDAVQRSERRMIVDILVNCRSIVETTNYLIEQIENNLETPASIPNTSEGSTTIL